MPSRSQDDTWILQGRGVLGEDTLPDRPDGGSVVVIAGNRIQSVERGRHPHPDVDCGDSTLAAGFIDLQVNGAAGCDFLSPTADGLAAADRHLLSTGTVAYLPTLITAEEAQTRAALAAFASRMRDGQAPRVLGVHLEGPFLSPARAGAHPPAHLRRPSTEWISALIAEFPGVVRMVTLAPELEGALSVVDVLVAHRIVAAVGHSNATFAQTVAAFDRGASVATHVFNAMAPFHHREVGVVGAALSRPEVTCSVIADLVHLHPVALRAVIDLKGPDRTALVTDAVAAAGAPGAEHRLGGSRVRVEAGAPRLPDGTLAGSVLAMPDAIRNVTGLGVGRPAAARMAAHTPGRVLGLDVGVVPGARADLVALDDAGIVRLTVVNGRVVFRR